MTIEAGVLVGSNHEPIHWHLPPGRNVVALPDSRPLWDVIWENRDRVIGFAHSHPGSGRPGPSWEDITTFSAVERALGKLLYWWIASSDELVVCVRDAYFGNGFKQYDYPTYSVDTTPPWLGRLRELSLYQGDNKSHQQEKQT